MALGALTRGTPVSIVPVGMNYFSAHKFRSRAVIEFGDTVVISPSLIHEFQNGKKRDAIGTVMSDLSQALAAVTVSAPDFETLNVRTSQNPLLIYHANNRVAHPCSTSTLPHQNPVQQQK